MGNPLNVLAGSLQETSRALSVKGAIEQAMLQESAVQLIGQCLLDGKVDLLVVDDGTAEQATRVVRSKGLGDRDGAQVLRDVALGAWVGRTSAATVLINRVGNAEDWEALPIQLQNFVSETQMPCHLVLAVQQISLEGDDRHRHYVLPVFAILSDAGADGINSYYAFVDKGLRDQAIKDPVATKESSAITLEPYLRIVTSYIVANALKATS